MDKIKNIIQQPMSNNLIEKYFNGHANIKSLEEITNYTDLDQVFENYNYCILFIAIRNPNDGHWVCMIKTKNNKLEYCDSYGSEPLEILDELTDLYNQNYNLLNLIKNSKYKNNFYYNTVKYQKLKDNIQTCGRYATFICILRILIPNFNLKMFKKIMDILTKKLNLDYDGVVAEFVDKN